MSGGLNPMSQQNVPSPSFQANQMNPGMNPNMMPVSNMVHGPVAQTNQVGQVAAPQSHPQASSNQSAAAAASSSSSSSSTSTSSQHDLNRLKNLVSSLRENLKNFFIISGMNLEYNIQIDNLNKNLEQPPKLEKSLEDILALCNQIELCLRTIQECAIQSRDSQNFLPFQVSHDFHLDATSQPSMMNNLRSYSDYLNVIKKQVAYSKSIYEILSDSAKQIKHNDQSQQQQPQQQQQQQLQQQHPQQQQQQPVPPSTLPPNHHHVPQPPPSQQQISPQLMQSMQQQQQSMVAAQHPQLLSTQMQHSGNI